MSYFMWSVVSKNGKYKMLITVSNLFPRPDQPTRGMYNSQLFREMAGLARVQRTEVKGSQEQALLNICLVPEWRVWRWPAIRRWIAPDPITPSTVYLPIFYIPFLGRSINWWFCSKGLKREAKFSLNKSPIYNDQSTVYYVPWLFPDGVAVARAICGSGARLWLMVLGSDTFHLKSPARRRKILEACQQAEGIVCVAQVLADRLAAAGVPRRKLHVVPNGVDTSLFRLRNRRELSDCQISCPAMHQRDVLLWESSVGETLTTQLLVKHQWKKPGNSATTSKTILFIGNLVPVKGPDVLLKAFSELERKLSSESLCGQPLSTEELKNPTTELLIIGTGPMRRQLERIAHHLKIAERVHFLGNRSHDEVAQWMNLADVLCLTSRSEGMPNVVVEALASGLPVVATAVGACPELLADEQAARLCLSEDVSAIADGLRAMLELKVDRQALAGRHAQHYSWRRQAESLLRVMESN